MKIASLRRAALAVSLAVAASCGGDPTLSGSSGHGGAASSSGADASTATTGAGGGACAPGDVEACYSGPAPTMGVGACKAGQRACQADGTFGACTGEVLPTAESCGTLVDDNCDGQVNEGCVCMSGSTAPCYTGDPTTMGVGICKAGMHTCAADGSGFGLCMGQVLPQLENCLSPQDEDCNGVAEACTGTGLWARRYGDAVAQSASAVANHQGGAVITGSLQGSADFGGGTLTSLGLADVYVASLDTAGAFVWARRFGDASAQSGVDVAVDSLGNTVIIGDFAGTIDFGGGALTSLGLTDVFVAKFDPAGGHLWSKRYGDAMAQNGKGIAVDGAGNVIITGSFAGTMTFGASVLTSMGLLTTDVFVAKLNPSGQPIWAKQFGDALAAQSGKAVAVDGAGNVVVTGDVAGTINFGGGALTSAGLTDVFVAAFNQNGAYSWGKLFGDATAQTAGGVAVDAVGNVVITGDAAGKVNFGGGMLTSAGGSDVYLARFTSSGAHLWSKLFGGAGADHGRDVAVDPMGGIVIIGDFPGTINFGGTALTAMGTDVFVAKLDPLAGAHLWSHRHGDAQVQSGLGVAADISGVLVAGSFAGALDFGGGSAALTSAGTTDAFVAKLAP
jgi:hypothetical protein